MTNSLLFLSSVFEVSQVQGNSFEGNVFKGNVFFFIDTSLAAKLASVTFSL